MVLCIIAFIVFGILGIFSAKYRTYAKESFSCVVRRITFRPCETKFDQKLKSKITGKLMKRSPSTARFVFKHFEILSWIMVITTIISLVIMGNSIYNLYTYGTCDPHSTTCIFNPGAITCGSDHCAQKGCTCESMGCDAPNYTACEGNCTCTHGICG